jgi:uncharacterized phiE125 gp8 family phage protein
MPQETLQVISLPGTEVVTLDDAKAWCRIEIDDDDDLVQGLIVAAREWCETYLKRSFVPRQYLFTIDYFPNRLVFFPSTIVWENYFMNSRLYPYAQAQIIFLPKPPLVSVDEVQYYDTEGNLQSLDPTAYLWNKGTPARLAPQPGTMWPSTQDRINGVQITYTAGVDMANTPFVPWAVQVAVKELVATWYRNREGAAGNLTEIPFGVKSLLNTQSVGFYA